MLKIGFIYCFNIVSILWNSKHFQMTSILVTLKLFLIFWEDLQICEGCDMVVSSRCICSDVLSQSAWSILPVYFWIIPRTTRIISNLWLTQEWYFVFGFLKGFLAWNFYKNIFLEEMIEFQKPTPHYSRTIFPKTM